jgi:hypothetical protein
MFMCKFCGKENEFKDGYTKQRYCNRVCWYKSQELKDLNRKRFLWSLATLEQKFERMKVHYEKNVIRKEGCWDWGGYFDKNGYGLFHSGHSRQTRAHRFSWELYNGKIPQGLNVLHRCDNPKCSNPEHLFLGTTQDNAIDMAQKGRSTLGEKNPNSKLSDDDVREIRKRLEMGVTQTRVANDFSMSYNAIRRIKLGQSWKHII